MIRGQPGLDELDFDDLYNNLKVYEHELKGVSNSNSQNIAFLSTEVKGSTLKQSTAEPAHIPKGYTQAISSKVPTAPNYLLQIDEDAMEEIDIRWQVAMITARIRKFMRKTGRSIDLKPKNGITFDKFNSKSLVGTDNNEDIDWTKEFDAEPVTYAMMALTGVEQDDWSIEFDAEHMHFGQDGLDDFDWSNKADDAPVSLALMATNSELGITIRLQLSLESLEVMLKTHEKNEYAWGDKYEQMEYDLKIRDLKLEEKQKELDQALKERDDFKAVLSRSTVGSYYPMDWIIEDLESKLSLHSSRAYTTRTPYKTTKTRKLFFKSIWVKKGSTVGSQAVLPQTVKKSAMINPKQTWKPKGNYLDSVNRGKSRRRSSWTRLSLTEDALECMTRGQDTLLFKRVQKVVMWLLEMTLKVEESQEKGTIKTSCLDFEKVSYVEELKLIFICFSNLDKKHNVLFTDKECLILSPKFKFVDEDLVILRAPRKNDVYSLDLKNIIPSGGITCLVAKATEDEAVLWHRRLGHLSYTNVLLQKKVSLSSVEQVYMKACMFDDQILSCQSFIMMIKGLLLCGKEKNICAKMDVKSAFLFMANIQEEVYVKQPPGMDLGEGLLMKLCFIKKDRRDIMLVRYMLMIHLWDHQSLLGKEEVGEVVDVTSLKVYVLVSHVLTATRPEHNVCCLFCVQDFKSLKFIIFIVSKGFLVTCRDTMIEIQRQEDVSILGEDCSLAMQETNNYAISIYRRRICSSCKLLCSVIAFLKASHLGSAQRYWLRGYNIASALVGLCHKRKFNFFLDDSNGMLGIFQMVHLFFVLLGTPTQSAAHSQRTASVQGTASFHSTANSQGTAEIQGTDDFQGMAEPHDAASIPKSPNDYTPTDASQTSGGDEGLLDVYALNRELETQGWQTLSQAKINYVSSRPNSSHLSKVVCSHWSKHHALWVEVSKLKKQKREERSIRKKLIETRCKILRSIEASNVRSETTKELDLETTQSTARQEEERKRFEELKKTKSKTTLKKPTSLAQERNQMMSFLKGQGYKNLQKLKYPQMKELYDKVQASIKDSFKDFIPMDSEKEKEMLNGKEDAKKDS
ncbi:hypothetical protein Tco_0361247 [Tanacetum coccineum]